MGRIFIALTICLSVCTSVLAADYPDYRIKAPRGWADRKHISGDLLRQIVEPGNNAMIEIYCSKGTVPDLNRLADAWEKAGRGRGMSYLNQRHASKSVQYPYKNTPAIRREYSGNHNGVILSSMVNFMQYDGFIIIVVGVYPRDHKEFGIPLVTAFSTFQPGASSLVRNPVPPKAPKKAAPLPGVKQPGLTPEQVTEKYYQALASEDLNGLRQILTASSPEKLEDELAAYALVFKAVDQTIFGATTTRKRFSTDKTGCAVRVMVAGEVIQADGKERFRVDEPFVLLMRQVSEGGWKIERVVRESGLKLARLGISAQTELKELIGD